MNIDAHGEQIYNVQDIFRTLRSLQLTRSQIAVKFSGDNHSYASLVLHTDLKHRQFVIDEPLPASINTRIASGEVFTIIAHYEGIQVIFKGQAARLKTSPMSLLLDKDIKQRAYLEDSIAIDFPSYIFHKQRRNSFRAPLPASTDARITLCTHRREEDLEGTITDLSTMGIGCRFPGLVRPPIERQESFENCCIAINNEFELHCCLTAKNPLYQRVLNCYSCGFQFHNLSRAQQKSVDYYVLAVQRQARKQQQAEH
jgi:c-di-GMP-binding flagellar brake protein YcgR